MCERMLLGEVVVQVAEQLGELLGEVVGRRLAAVPLQREHRARIGARCAAEPEVDTAREQAAERAEVLRHLERAVVRQHHAAAAHADARGGGSDRPDPHLRAGARETGGGVVLSHPVALIAERLGVAGEVDRVVQRVRAGRPLRDRRLGDYAEPERHAQASTPAPTCSTSTAAGSAAGAAACCGRTRGMSRAAAMAPIPANAAPTTNAWWKPLLSAGLRATWPARSDV